VCLTVTVLVLIFLLRYVELILLQIISLNDQDIKFNSMDFFLINVQQFTSVFVIDSLKSVFTALLILLSLKFLFNNILSLDHFRVK